MNPPIRTAPQARGFALVVTLTLLVLLTVLALGLLSLSAVTLRSSSQNVALMEARSNARLALMVAIGELQKELGPDQRISASGAILAETSVPHPHWTGVWDSWIAGPTSAAPVNPGYPSAESHHQTLGNQPAESMHPDYGNKDKHFRRWLLSLNPDEAIDPATPASLALAGQPMPDQDETAIRLVGKGSLGESAPATDFVSARLIGIKPSVPRGLRRGRYAWWVGDESQKARVMNDSYQGETLASADRIFRAQAPASTGTNSIPGLTNLDPTQQSKLKGLPSLDTLDLVPGVTEINDGGTYRASQKNFHSVTPFSRAVLADVREGGLKRDLSTLLERAIDPAERTDDFMLYRFNTKDAWANDPSKYPTLPDTPQECVPIQDLAAFYQLYDQSKKAGIKYDSSPLSDSIQVSTPDQGTYTTYTTGYQREYTTLYRNPVPIKIQFAISVQAVPITQADRDAVHAGDPQNMHIPPTDTHKMRFAVIPAVTLWNPFNVPIVMEGGQTLAQQIVVKPPPLAIVVRKKRSDGTVYQANTALTFSRMVTGLGERRADMLRLNFARNEPIVLQPGEVQVFSAPVTGDYFLFLGKSEYHAPQNLNSEKNLVDAKRGWDSTSVLPLRFSAHGGYPGSWRLKKDAYNTNVLVELAPNGNPYLRRLNYTMNGSDEFEFTIYSESAQNTDNKARVASTGTSPVGSAFSFHLSQRLFSSGGGQGGHGFLNLRNMGLNSRYGSPERPIAFNGEIFEQGAATIELGTAMEPIRASVIAAATAAGESVPLIQFGLMAGCETSELANGGIFAGRKFPSRPFLHSSPLQLGFIDQSDPTAPYNHGWNWWIDEMNSILEAMVQESQSGNGFHGGGYTAESGTTHVVQQEIPVTPPISIAALSHARIGGFTLANEAPAGHGFTGMSGQQMESSGGTLGRIDDAKATLGFQRVTATGQGGLYPHVLQAIGNSYANPNLAAGVAFNPAWKRFYSQDDGEREVTFADHSYLANKALWDEFFFSSITPQPDTVEIFGGSGRDAKQVASDFFSGARPLPNRRIVPYSNGPDAAALNSLFAEKDVFTDGLADKIAAHLMVEGGFNINSTSVDAWKVFFSSLKGKPVAYLDGGKTPMEADTGENAPVGMGTLPNGEVAVTADTEDPRDPAQWKGLRGITDAEIDALAQAMVCEVKKRGPFLSLSEFVNRRLDANNTDGTALKGALQAALDYDGSDNAGPEVTINRNFRDASRKLDSEVGGIDFAFKDAAKGPAAYGSSAYVDQADVLRQFAEQLTPRGDTFVIRTYGDSLDAAGNVMARAWCEAVVQRTPDYVDEADGNHVKSSDLKSAANLRFGRSFQIVSFRWLNSSEI
ncbi:hypothetical protein HZ994_06945 [Akkermansiaceae bacterium]|nr:hypothetical protein HZ994_06945 [Akkermansiaceae bacterium]